MELKDTIILILVVITVFVAYEYIVLLADMENLLDDYKNHSIVTAEYVTPIEPYKGLVPDEIFTLENNKKLRERLGGELIDNLIKENCLTCYKFKDPVEVEYNHNPNDIRKEPYLKIVIQVDARRSKDEM